jgi:hypothetical protein
MCTDINTYDLEGRNRIYFCYIRQIKLDCKTVLENKFVAVQQEKGDGLSWANQLFEYRKRLGSADYRVRYSYVPLFLSR